MKKKILAVDEALKHPDHSRPKTRREFISQGFMTGSATIAGANLLNMFSHSSSAFANLAGDIDLLKAESICDIKDAGAGKIPFICFDLAGGANISGSNVLVGGPGGQEDFLSTAGYSKLGLPGDRLPGGIDGNGGDFINREIGLAFHSESAMLQGILEKLNQVGGGAQASINGAVIPARSDNDTRNNPHNPMYAIAQNGNYSYGALLNLIGSQNSNSGGNSMAGGSSLNPGFIDSTMRPTKIDSPDDVTGLVNTGKLVDLLNKDDAVRVMESIQRISDMKLTATNEIAQDAELQRMIRCAYVQSAHLTDKYASENPQDNGVSPLLNPAKDENIRSLFTDFEIQNDNEFRKTAAVMKMVVNGFAAAGTITIGGFDYHVGDRATGEQRDLRAGRCMGACLAYAHLVGVPLMIYVFSDGSVASNGIPDNSALGNGKGQWTGDNSSTAASFFLVYNPGSRPQLLSGGDYNLTEAQHQQLGHMRREASTETASRYPAANSVDRLVETVVLNYMALHGEVGRFTALNHGLGNSIADIDRQTAFQPIVSGTIG
ncbi:MAG: general secretion pathway protein GspF [Gammaproteobacteria bacterium]|nr:general secretion pathway protein GspF [Gammaproteobacteria bacterium]